MERSSAGWLRGWSLAISLLAHALALAAFVVAIALRHISQPVPVQIELAASAAAPPAEQAAQLSPSHAEPRPQSAAARAERRPPEAIRPLSTVQDKTDTSLPPTPPSETSTPAVPALSEPRKAQTADAAPTVASGAKIAPEAPQEDPHPAGPPPDYIGQIGNRLQKLLRYPAAARAARQEGTAMLRFTLDHTGHVISWNLVSGSGVAALDREAGELIQRASPFPPFPPSYRQDSMRITVPVEFSLKRP